MKTCFVSEPKGKERDVALSCSHYFLIFSVSRALSLSLSVIFIKCVSLFTSTL